MDDYTENNESRFVRPGNNKIEIITIDDNAPDGGAFGDPSDPAETGIINSSIIPVYGDEETSFFASDAALPDAEPDAFGAGESSYREEGNYSYNEYVSHRSGRKNRFNLITKNTLIAFIACLGVLLVFGTAMLCDRKGTNPRMVFAKMNNPSETSATSYTPKVKATTAATTTAAEETTTTAETTEATTTTEETTTETEPTPSPTPKPTPTKKPKKKKAVKKVATKKPTKKPKKKPTPKTNSNNGNNGNGGGNGNENGGGNGNENGGEP